MRQHLDVRTYSLADQRRFAALSGDYNPMHVDEVAARRTLFGEAVVHGMHLALRALDAFCDSRGRDGARLTRVRATFPNAAPVGREVTTELVEDGDARARVDARVAQQCALQLRVEFGAASALPLDDAAPAPETLGDAPAMLGFDGLDGRRGPLEPWLDEAAARAAFPALMSRCGAGFVARLLSLTRLVGMECPGLNSIFSAFDLRIAPDAAGPLCYEVTRATPSISFVRMALAGAGQKGRIDAFYRPPPARQADMAAVRERVAPDALAGVVALVVGGSRGLGEVTARLVAASGGHAVITYHRGHADAEAVRDEIRAAGGSCEALRLDVTDADDVRRTVAGLDVAPTQLHYFASPKIAKRGAVKQAGVFDAALEAHFERFYVAGFEVCCRAALARADGPLVAFYPSTIVLDEPDDGMREYAAAKQAGEALCERLAAEDPRLRVLVRRLPVVATDQVAALMSVSVDARDPLDVMLEVLGEL